MNSDRDNLKQEAERMGLIHLTEAQLDQFAKAKASAQNLAGAISQDLHMYDEPAHTFHAGEEASS